MANSKQAERLLRSSLAALWVGMMVNAADAQIVLQPADDPIEVVDALERISGNAATGVAFMSGDGENSRIRRDNLWVYLPEKVPEAIQLRMASIDGRYVSEASFETSHLTGPLWVALALEKYASLGFLDRYDRHDEEVAVLVSSADNSRYYPALWGRSHSADAPEPPTGNERLRVYVNTERAAAFVVGDDEVAQCMNTSSTASFKFNALCDISLGKLRRVEQEDGNPVGVIEIHRRVGMRSLGEIILYIADQ